MSILNFKSPFLENSESSIQKLEFLYEKKRRGEERRRREVEVEEVRNVGRSKEKIV